MPAQFLKLLSVAASETPDAELLARLIATRDDAAFNEQPRFCVQSEGRSTPRRPCTRTPSPSALSPRPIAALGEQSTSEAEPLRLASARPKPRHATWRDDPVPTDSWRSGLGLVPRSSWTLLGLNKEDISIGLRPDISIGVQQEWISRDSKRSAGDRLGLGLPRRGERGTTVPP